jgi:murein DD-endopeptidase MepM/ murein hydrolase activator NlpD
LANLYKFIDIHNFFNNKITSTFFNPPNFANYIFFCIFAKYFFHKSKHSNIFMKFKLLITILYLTTISFVAVADPTFPTTTSTETPNLTTDSTNYFANLIHFYNSYTQTQTNQTNNPTDEKLNLIYSAFDTTNISSIINPYGVEIKNLPDSILIDCSDYHYPTISQHITSRFGIRGARFHHGIDIGVKYGDTICSPFAGTIRYVNYQRRGYGHYIIIRHNNGLESIMAHFSKTLVSIGDTINAGDPVGLGGSTGRSTGPHLHLEFRLLGNSFNPEKLINFNTTELKNISNNGSFLITRADTYSHQDELEEMKRAAYHRVRSGETLSHIARRYGTTVSRLCALNRLKQTSILQIGQRIRYR